MAGDGDILLLFGGLDDGAAEATDLQDHLGMTLDDHLGLDLEDHLAT